MSEFYAVRGSDLSTLADHIRGKGQTEETLIWPDGYYNAIDDISVGADVNVTIDENGHNILVIGGAS